MLATVKTFRELTTGELYKLLQLRSEVFVVEQQCIYMDMDNLDHKALHVLGWEGSNLVAYARIFKPGDYFDTASIGRVSVKTDFRGEGLGMEIMGEAIKAVRDVFKTKKITLSAQTYLKEFYLNMGFLPIGEQYLEDDIPHIKMELHPEDNQLK